ncbi:MerR family transcriptional regulator [Planomonospora alba]|uniref:MerR family transcriptional regulator n=1 Tax=Planomonospora alba TaxID=161354 RepID=UPI0031F197BC
MDEEFAGGLLPIGRFARLCRLSVKQLRHYDELGLLVPAWVDPASGYRYYRPGQARQALSIGLLRSLDVPLAVIGRVLSGPDPEGELERVRTALEAELARRRRTLATLERVLGEGLPAPRVEVVSEPARRVLLARDAAACMDDIGRAVGSCAARLAACGAAAGPMVGVFPVELDPPVPVTVAAAWEGAAGAGGGGRADPPPGTEPGVLAGGVFARVVHVGPYDQVALAYHALLVWCAEHGHTARGPVREVCVTDPAVTAPERLVTHLMIRLEDMG